MINQSHSADKLKNLLDNGYEAIPCNGKVPTQSGWASENYDLTSPPPGNWDGTNIGIRTGQSQYRWLFSSLENLQGHLTEAYEQEMLELMNQGHPAPVSITLDLGCEVKTTLDIHPTPGGKSPSYTRRITELELGEKGGAKDE